MPAAKPPALKLLTGRSPGRDSGGRKVNPGLQPVKAAPTMPSWLPKEARAEWKRVVPELERLGILSKLDRGSLTAYCLAWSRLVQAQLQAEEEGLISSNSQGKIKNPVLSVLEQAEKSMTRWAIEFGLTPCSRGKFAAPKLPGEQEDLD